MSAFRLFAGLVVRGWLTWVSAILTLARGQVEHVEAEPARGWDDA